MSPEKRRTREERVEELSSVDRFAILFAKLPQDQIQAGGKVFVHGALRDLYDEFPSFFPNITHFGKAGGWVNNPELSYAHDTLFMMGLVHWEDIGTPDQFTLCLDGERLWRWAERLNEKLSNAGAPELSDWDGVSQRFAELIELNKQKEPSELIAYS